MGSERVNTLAFPLTNNFTRAPVPVFPTHPSLVIGRYNVCPSKKQVHSLFHNLYKPDRVISGICLLLSCFALSYLFQPSEPLIKRSHSPSSGEDSVFVVYAPTDNVNDDDNNIDDSRDKDSTTVRNGRHVSESAVQHPQPISLPIIFHSDKVRIREAPFDTERDFQLFDWDESFHGQDLDLPPSLSGDGFNATIPPQILRIIADLQENDTKSKPQPHKPANAGDDKMPNEPPAASNSSAHDGPGLPNSQNVSHDVSAQPLSPPRQTESSGVQLSPPNAAKKSKQARPLPKLSVGGNASSEVSGAEFEKRRKDTATKPPHVGKSKKATDMESSVQIMDTVTKSPHPGKARKEINAQTMNKQSNPHKLAFLDLLANAQSMYPLFDPDGPKERPQNEDTGTQDFRYKAQQMPYLQHASNGDHWKRLEDDDGFDLPEVDSLATAASETKLTSDGFDTEKRLDASLNRLHNASHTKVNPKAPDWVGLVRSETKRSEAMDLSAAAREAEIAKTAAREKFNVTVWKGVQKERKRLLRSKCEEHVNHKSKKSVYDSHSIVDRKHNFLYCPVEKSASTFFRRFMYSLVHNNRSKESKEITSPFKIPIEAALAFKYDTLRTLFRKGQEHFADDSVKFIVAREPFSRLFSAYVDKLLVPNSVYWPDWGVPIVSAYRQSPSNHSLACGNDVTFPEFVKYVIAELHSSDEHVVPVNARCSPCEVKFSVIAHMETLRSDFEYLTSVLKVSIANYSTETLMDDVTTDAIMDSTYSAFEFHKDLKPCVTKHEMCKRLWRKMQLRGIISDELSFPLTQEETVKISAADMMRLLLDARKRSQQNTLKLRQQTYQALKDAFEKVPTDDILKLVKIYSLDFELFGYSKYPNFLDMDF
ncbi:uncharacterized protein [Littorina saxatilis]|uniref:uncharacterized protein n=1 Tax=Littorina saxatilis TaxID=31220 RepID=UPI0038B6221F